MAKYGKDHASRSISIGPFIPATSPLENANTTPANNGTVTGPGDEFSYIPYIEGGYQYPVEVAFDATVAGGTLSALTVTLEFSDDGVNWNAATPTITGVTGGRAIVNPALGRFMRANMTVRTVATGTPVIVVGISC